MQSSNALRAKVVAQCTLTIARLLCGVKVSNILCYMVEEYRHVTRQDKPSSRDESFVTRVVDQSQTKEHSLLTCSNRIVIIVQTNS